MSGTRSHRVAATLVWISTHGWLAAAQPQEAAPRESGIDLAPVIELPRLVDLAAARLGINIEYDTKLTGQVTLRLHDELSASDLWSLTNRLLAARGFTTVRMSGDPTLSVVPLPNAAALARLEAPEAIGDREETGPAGFLAVVVPLGDRRVEDVAAAVKPLLSAAGVATPLPESRALLIADLRPRTIAALEVVGALASEVAAAGPVEIGLANLEADRLITLLAQVNAKRLAAGSAPLRGEVLASPDGQGLLLIAPPAELESWRTLITQLDRREGLETISYTPGSFPLEELAASVERLVGGDDRFHVVADRLTGSLVVTASPTRQERVRDLLDQLARAPEATRRPTRTFRLRNRDAEEVLGVVDTLMSAGLFGSAAGTGGPPAEAANPSNAGRANSPASVEPMQLASDPATNSIIAIGGAQELQRLEQLLRDLDVRRPQVLLEVLIISLSESDSLDLGVEIEKLINGPNDTVAKLSSLFGLSSTGAGSSGIADRGAGFTGIVLNPGDFSVVLRALKTLNNGRSLSMPKVLVASNEQASINSVLEQPYTTLNASDTVATTSFGGSSNAGTEVSVRPQIAEGDHLRLEYQVSLSAFVGEAADASLPPPRQQNNIDSVATIPDGYTIAVGGIELTTEGYAERGIPLLSDLPVLGEAFKSRSRSASRSRFYVFIRPTILRDRDFEDLKYLSDRDVDTTGVDDGWPEVSPRLIR